MKNLKLITLMLITLIGLQSCEEPVGKIDGSVYWKYNDCVGNKPDAGSKVKLFSYDEPSLVYNSSVDINGEFRIDNVNVGKYLMVVESENTNTSESDMVQELFFYINDLDKIFGTKLNKELKTDFELYNKIDEEIINLMTSNDTYDFKLIKKKEEELNDISTTILTKIRRNIFIDINLSPLLTKIKLRNVRIEDGKVTSEQFDLGITYF